MPFVEDRNDRVKWALRRLYYRQRRPPRHAWPIRHRPRRRCVPSDVRVEGLAFTPTLHATPSLYELIAPGFDAAVVHLTQDGRVWTTRAAEGVRP